jgi:6-phosphogluconolactonase
MIDPTGKYLLAANKHTNDVVVFKRNRKSGKLSKTGINVHIPQPVCLKMIPVNEK